MFYGIPQEKQQSVQEAIAVLQDVYPGIYAADMLICMWRNVSFREDADFMKSVQSHVSNENEASLLWRLHVLAWAAQEALQAEGDFVECGVLKGFCSAVLCQYLNFNELDRKFYLYDTFSGLPEETSTEKERENWNYSRFDEDELYNNVVEVFSKYKNVDVIKGMVPTSFEQACPEKISFLHIDMNSMQAEMLALEYLFDKVVPGGLIVLDDYGWACNKNQNVAEKKFMFDRQHHILELPTGQGLIIKHA